MGSQRRFPGKVTLRLTAEEEVGVRNRTPPAAPQPGTKLLLPLIFWRLILQYFYKIQLKYHGNVKM